MRRLAAALIALSALPAAASTGNSTVSGAVLSAASSRCGVTPGAGLSGATVRAWQVDAPSKSVVIAATATTGAGGAWSMVLVPGQYYFDAQGPSGGSDYTDAWLDALAPQSCPPGFVPEDADLVAVGSNNISLNAIYLFAGGGIDGVIYAPDGAPQPGVHLRAELSSDPRVHHNDTSGGNAQYHPEHPGEYDFRGLLPGAYEILTYWLPGTYETHLVSGFNVNANVQTAAGPIVLSNTDFSTDSFNGLHDLPSGSFPGQPHSTYTSSGTLIAPKDSGDVDGFCFTAQSEDRFQLSASAANIESSGRKNPFVDPVLRFSGPGLASALFDDDSGGGQDALITDTSELAGGHYCAQVTTFGDTSFNGTTQGSTGRFVFSATLLNRRPRLSTSTAGPVQINEGDTAGIDLTFSDADGDPVSVSAVLADSGGNVVDTQSFALPSPAAWSWTAPQDAAAGSPYTVTFSAIDTPSDSEAPRPAPSISVTINVAEVVLAPLQVAPPDGSRVTTATPALEVQDLGEPPQPGFAFDFELYGSDGSLIVADSIAEDPSGHDAYTPPPLAENATVAWRVRARHGSHVSAWTGFWHFFVDTRNDPPPAPVLLKPADGAEVPVRRPGFSASSVQDPEGDAVSLYFQIAADDSFATLIETSDAVPETLISTTIPWTPSHELAWGTSYAARVWAVDARGASSDYSNIVHFSVRADALPAVPQLAGVFASQCQGYVFSVGAPPAILVTNVQDPDGEAVLLELQIFDFAADPDTATPSIDVVRTQSPQGTTTAMDVSAMRWTDGAHYQVRTRAGDGALWTTWSTACDFSLQLTSPVADAGTPDAGQSPDAGAQEDAGSSDAGETRGVRSGCGCNGASPQGAALALLALVLLRPRRRSAQ